MVISMKINKLLQVLSGLPLITAAGVGALFSATACSNQLTIKTLYTQFVKNNFYRFDGTPYETHACD
ncbi:hypothetical protein FACS1894166_01100 [Bacilli bacterium]|nr:hypothetical protein FACS1894166_01100 [Bacilli bacterium]